MSALHLWIDADACPVRDTAVSIAAAMGVPATLVCDEAHILSSDNAEVLTVTRGADSADLALVNRLRPGDAVITQDYGLAALCLARRANVMDQDGRVYTEENIMGLLTRRHENRKTRMAGGRVKGPRRRSPEQDRAFAAAFSAWLEELLKA